MGWIAGGQIVGVLNNFLVLKILTDNLTVKSYGYFALWISVVMFARQIIYDPVSIVTAKEVVSSSSVGDYRLNYFSVVRFLNGGLMCGLLIVGLILSCAFIFYVSVSISVCILTGCIYLFSNGAQGVYLNMLNALKLRKWAAIGIATDSLVKLLLLIAAFFLLDSTFMAASVVVAVSSILVFMIVQRICRRFDSPHSLSVSTKWPPAKQLIILSIPFVAPCMLTALRGIGDKVFMAYFIGVEELAAYNVLLQLGFIPVMLVVGVIQTYVSPDIYALAARGDDENKNKILVYLQGIIMQIALISVIAVIASFFLSEVIFKYTVGAKYIKYASYLPYFVLAGSVSGVAGLLNVTAIGVINSNRVGIVMFFSILAGLILTMTLIALSGFSGAIIGLIFSNLVMIFVFGTFVYYALRKDYKV